MPLPLLDWIRPEWPAPPNVLSLMTHRHGGVSKAPWDSMNLGTHVGDHSEATQQNRQRLQEALGTRPVFLKQVHGLSSVMLAPNSPNETEADACYAIEPGVACTIMVADCLPVLLCDRTGRWVAAAHAGWRGLAGLHGVGVLEHLLTVSPMHATEPDDILVWLGPCIGPDAFEVGEDVRQAFCDPDATMAAFFSPSSGRKWRANLAGLARARLQSWGIHNIYGNHGQPEWCTVTQSSRFFSHRRDSHSLGQSGRMAACIWLEG